MTESKPHPRENDVPRGELDLDKAGLFVSADVGYTGRHRQMLMPLIAR
jgi:hypothetical protein